MHVMVWTFFQETITGLDYIITLWTYGVVFSVLFVFPTKKWIISMCRMSQSIPVHKHTHTHAYKFPVLNLNPCPTVSVLHNTGYRTAAAISEWALVMCFFVLFGIFSAEFRHIDFHELHVQQEGFSKSNLEQSNTVAPPGHLTNTHTPSAN